MNESRRCVVGAWVPLMGSARSAAGRTTESDGDQRFHGRGDLVIVRFFVVRSLDARIWRSS